MDEHSQQDDLTQTIYAIGDIHGRVDLLNQIVREIQHDMDSHGVTKATTITLGDYVDRGSDSRGVLDRLARNPFPTAHVAIRGNHEWMLQAFMSDPSVLNQWRRLGGIETLQSYGVAVDQVMLGKGFDQAADALRASIPREHLKFLLSLENSVSVGGFFFCHAGVRPGVPLDRQSADDLMWIRHEFLDRTADFGKLVIHGHTPVASPDVRPNRINIDTGAYFSGRLTCLVLDHGDRRFLSTDSSSAAFASGSLGSR